LPQNKSLNESIKNVVITTVKTQKPENTSQLIEFVQKTTNLSKNEIFNIINQLVTEGKIQLKINREQVSTPFGNYLFASESVWYWTLMAVALATMVAVFTIPQDLYPLAYVRNVLGVIFVLFLPGYSFIQAFFLNKVPIKTSSENFDKIERFVLSIALSIALTPIVGLILYFTPLGIGLVPVTLSLLALSAVLATAAMARMYIAKSETTQKTY
jgi:hypothetical protein